MKDLNKLPRQTVKKVVQPSSIGKVSKLPKELPTKKNLTKADQEELAPICRQRFENRKKNPLRFKNKKK